MQAPFVGVIGRSMAALSGLCFSCWFHFARRLEGSRAGVPARHCLGLGDRL
jgi:hypothetical protein